MIVAAGFRPDLAMLREVRLAFDPWLECAAGIGPLIDPNLHSCGTVRPYAPAGAGTSGAHGRERAGGHRCRPASPGLGCTSCWACRSGAAALVLFGGPAAAVFAVLHGAGNGLLTITKGTLPLALFGPAGYGLAVGAGARGTSRGTARLRAVAGPGGPGRARHVGRAGAGLDRRTGRAACAAQAGFHRAEPGCGTERRMSRPDGTEREHDLLIASSPL